ncbi:hypothetical protein ACHAQA_007797 [Verticillium albo-atrum]
MARATDVQGCHIQTAALIASACFFILFLATGTLLARCAYKRRCEAAIFELHRRKSQEDELENLGTIKTLERELSCCTCHPALPWNAEGGTRERPSPVDATAPKAEMVEGAAQTGDSSSPGLSGCFPEREGVYEMTFWEDTPGEHRPAQSPALRPVVGAKDLFVVGEDDSDEGADRKGGK